MHTGAANRRYASAISSGGGGGGGGGQQQHWWQQQQQPQQLDSALAHPDSSKNTDDQEHLPSIFFEDIGMRWSLLKQHQQQQQQQQVRAPNNMGYLPTRRH